MLAVLRTDVRGKPMFLVSGTVMQMNEIWALLFLLSHEVRIYVRSACHTG